MKKKANKTEAVVAVAPVAEVKVKGRKVNPNSDRQKRIKMLNEKKASGTLKKGRPVASGSKRQIRLAELAMKKANGGGKQGRPVKMDSARQMRLAAMQAKLDAGVVIKRGRPAKEKVAKTAKVKKVKVAKVKAADTEVK